MMCASLLDEDHEDQGHDPQHHGHDLLERLPEVGVHEQLRDDRDCRTVDETAGRKGENPVGDVADVSACETERSPKHGAECRQKLELDGLLLRAPALDKDGKVANFMRNLRVKVKYRRAM